MKILCGTISLLFVFLLSSCKDEENIIQPPSGLPEVTIISPSPAEEIAGIVNVEIHASDDKGIVRIDFIVNDRIINSCPSSPCMFVWIPELPDSSLTSIIAKAYDADSNVAVSAPLNLLFRRLKGPTDLTFTSSHKDTIILSWTDNDRAETGFSIEEQSVSSSDSIPFHEIARINANSVNYFLTGKDSTRTYRYKVRAIKDRYFSFYSNEVSLSYSGYNKFSVSNMLGYFMGGVNYLHSSGIISASSYGNSVWFWDLNGNVIRKFYHPAGMQEYIISPDEQYVVTMGGGLICLWNSTTGEQLQTINHSGHRLSITPDNLHILSIEFITNVVKIFEVSSGDSIRSISVPTPVTALKVSNDGSVIITAEQGTLRYWNFNDGSMLHAEYLGHPALTVSSISFRHDDNYLACAGQDLRLFNYPSGTFKRTLSQHGETSVSFSRTGSKLVSCYSGTWEIWETDYFSKTDQVVLNRNISNAVFGPNENFIITGGDRIMIWEKKGRWR